MIPISQLPELEDDLDPDAVLPIVQDGVTHKVPAYLLGLMTQVDAFMPAVKFDLGNRVGTVWTSTNPANTDFPGGLGPVGSKVLTDWDYTEAKRVLYEVTATGNDTDPLVLTQLVSPPAPALFMVTAGAYAGAVFAYPKTEIMPYELQPSRAVDVTKHHHTQEIDGTTVLDQTVAAVAYSQRLFVMIAVRFAAAAPDDVTVELQWSNDGFDNVTVLETWGAAITAATTLPLMGSFYDVAPGEVRLAVTAQEEATTSVVYAGLKLDGRKS